MTSFLSYLFIRQGVQVLVVRAEEQIPQDGTPIAHDHVLVLQSRLHDGVDQDLQHNKMTTCECFRPKKKRIVIMRHVRWLC